MKHTIISILIIILHTTSYSQITPNEIMERADKALQGHQSISYTLKIESKSFSKNDTLINIANTILLYKPDDKAKFHHHIEEIEGYYPNRYKQIYKGDTLINLSTNDSSVFIVATKEKESTFFYNKQGIPSCVRNNFTGVGHFTKLLESKNIFDISLSENDDSYLIKFTSKGNKKFDDFHYIYSFDKETFLPITLIETTTFQEMNQYRSINLTNIKLDPNIPHKTFDIESNIQQNTKRVIYNPKTYFKKNVTLNENQKAPSIKQNTIKGYEFDLCQYKGKTVILDFWHIGCYPCIFSMPEMEQLSKKYDTSNVVVIGVNIVDSLDRLQPFLDKRNITYNHIYNGLNVAKDYQISVYPTLIIIDKNGNIFKRHEGWMVSKGLVKKMYVNSFHKKIKKSLKVKTI